MEPRVRAARDVCERISSGRVEPRVQKAEHGLASCDEPVVEERDDACERRGRCGRPASESRFTINDGFKVPALRRDLPACMREASVLQKDSKDTYVRVPTSRAVEHARKVGREGRLKARDSRRLVVRAREEVGEAAAGKVDGALRVYAHRRANGGHERTRSGEDGDERICCTFVHVVVDAVDAAVAGRIDHRDAAGTKGGVHVAKFAKEW